MAVTKTPKSAVLTLRFSAGTNAAGKPVIKSVHFQNVRSEVTDDDLYAVANSLAGLQNLTVLGIDRADTSTLISG